MSMKKLKIYTLLALLLMAGGVTMQGQIFSSVCETGQSMRYTVISQNPPEVELVQCEDHFGGVTIPDSVVFNGMNYAVVSIGMSAFALQGTQFNGPLSIPNTVRSIGIDAFSDCRFTGPLVIPNSVETIGFRAFINCDRFTSLTLSESLTVIEALTFLQCYGFRGDLKIPESVRYVTPEAFEDCRFDGTLYLSPHMDYIDGGFENCYMFKAVDIPEGVINILHSAFDFLQYATELTLPSTITFIGDDAFCRLFLLEQMTVKAIVPPYIEAETFLNTNRDIPVYIPMGTIEAYRSALYWSEFTNFIEVDFDGVDEQEENVEMELYPNPANGAVRIEGVIAAEVQVYNALGQLVKTVRGTNNVCVEGLPQGIYLLRISDTEGKKRVARVAVK